MNRFASNGCPECSDGHLTHDYTSGDYYCDKCGLICNEFYLQAPVRETIPGERESHFPLDHMETMGPSTEITPGKRDGHGNLIKNHRMLEIHRLRKTERFTKFPTTTARNLNHMLGYMSAVMSRLGLTRPAREFAHKLYTNIVNRKLTVGRGAVSLAAASIYAGCRYYSQPYSIEDIAKTVLDSGNDIEAKKQVGKAYRLIVKHLKLTVTPPQPADYLARYASELGLTGKTRRKAQELLEEAVRLGNPGGAPSSVAAALIYIACKKSGKKITQKKITEITGITDTTIRKRYREINSMILKSENSNS